MDELESIQNEISELQLAMDCLKARVREIPAAMAAQLKDDERLAAARFLYWTCPDMRTRDIAEGLLNVTDGKFRMALNQVTKDAPSGIKCSQCAREILVTTRSQLSALRHRTQYESTCQQCDAKEQERRDAEWERQSQASEERLRLLRTMPYADYLETPEWKQRRIEHLKGSGFRCQVCNAKDVLLNIHHRTYERRGQEYFKDLLTLCEKCHEIFHKAGRLAKS